MKKILSSICLLFLGVAMYAQGLQGIVVEKYYISNANDATVSNAQGGGTLPSGSITWRFYADLAPGYKLQAVYGVDVAPAGVISAGDHELRLETSTTFFNNEDRGAITPTFTKAQTALNSVMLDSWLSVGGACGGYFGIEKASDNGVSTTVNSNSMLQNNNPQIGVLLTAQDGLIAGSPEAVTFVGITPAQQSIFDATSQAGSLLSTYNGSWASLNGATGPDASNKVLIAQITTDGVLTYAFNIQVGTPTSGVERYVAINPTGAEIYNPTLSGVLNQPNFCPSVSLTSPANGATYFVGDTVLISATAADSLGTVSQVEFFVNGVSVGVDNTSPYSAKYVATVGAKNITAVATDNDGCPTTSSVRTITVGTNSSPVVSISSPSNGAVIVEGTVVAINASATDADGTISSVQFFVDGVSIGTDATSPYSINWTSVIGTHSLTVRATDNNSAATTSAAVSVNIISSSSSYIVGSTTLACDINTFCVPVSSVLPVNDVIGYDVVMQYDKTKVQPTGAVIVQNALVNPGYVSTANRIDAANGLFYLTLYFNSSAPSNSEFNGTGALCCVEFVKTAGFNAADTVAFGISSLQESYYTGIQQKLAGPGEITTIQNSVFSSNLSFWKDGSALGYDGTGTTTKRTDIYGDNNLCNSLSATAVQPDANGDFAYNLDKGSSINIKRDISNTFSVQPVVNGFDAFLVRRVLINDATFVPSVYQMIAMDVNTDGVISAGDLSQINQRAVLLIGEFKQAWNYTPQGTSLGPLSKDWLFVEQSILNTIPYLISSTFPFDDGFGFSKSRVPVTPFCHVIPVLSSSFGCSSIEQETYAGVLLGDVNGNFSTVGSGGSFKTSSDDKVVFDLAHAIHSNGFIDVPVAISSQEGINAVDFALKFNENKLTYNTLVGNQSYMSVLDNFNTTDRTFRFTSSSLTNIDMNQSLLMVRFATAANEITAADFNSTEAYLNGEPVNFEFTGSGVSSIRDINEMQVSVYPNPAKNFLVVTVSAEATLQLLDVTGKQVMSQISVSANDAQVINTENIASGVYLLKVSNHKSVSTKRVVISK